MTDECRVKLLQTDEAAGTMALYFKAVTQLLGRVPNTRRVGALGDEVVAERVEAEAAAKAERGARRRAGRRGGCRLDRLLHRALVALLR